ncbi:alpha/beta fold hydrolase [Paraburkholderia youngii]|uniref:alpha/beta fold hydrolase n=1 Tax=Paraburkholderia youngii TaxID=2782701 RepID=UPI003D1A35DD
MKRGYATTSVGQIHYVMDGDHEKTVVMIPHAGRSSRMYFNVAKELSKQYRVILLDVPGTGMSDTPSPHTEIPQYGEYIVEALDDLKVSDFFLFGLHGGNKIATSIAVRHPARVRAMIYAGRSHSIVPSNAHRAAAFKSTKSIADVVSPDEALSGSLKLWVGEFRSLSSAWWSDQVLNGQGRERLVTAASLVVDQVEASLHRPHFYRAAFAYDMEAELSKLTVPTLVLELATPTEDREVGRQGVLLEKLIRQSTLRVLECEDAYITTLEDKSEELAEIMIEYFRRYDS